MTDAGQQPADSAVWRDAGVLASESAPQLRPKLIKLWYRSISVLWRRVLVVGTVIGRRQHDADIPCAGGEVGGKLDALSQADRGQGIDDEVRNGSGADEAVACRDDPVARQIHRVRQAAAVLRSRVVEADELDGVVAGCTRPHTEWREVDIESAVVAHPVADRTTLAFVEQDAVGLAGEQRMAV